MAWWGAGCRQAAHPLTSSPQPVQGDGWACRSEGFPRPAPKHSLASRRLHPWPFPVRSCVRAGGSPRLSPAPSGEAACVISCGGWALRCKHERALRCKHAVNGAVKGKRVIWLLSALPVTGFPPPGLRVFGPQCLRPGCRPAASASQEARGVLGTQARLPGCDAHFAQHGGSESGHGGGHGARPGFRAVITVTMTAGGLKSLGTGDKVMMSPPCPQGPPPLSPELSEGLSPERSVCCLGPLARRGRDGLTAPPRPPGLPLPAHHPSPSPRRRLRLEAAPGPPVLL